MKIKNLAYAALVGVAAVAIRDRFGRAERSSQKEEGGSCTTTTSAAVADVLGSPLWAGLRDQGWPEVYLFEFLLRDEGPGDVR